MKILILGANGFIGYNLSKRILDTTDWEIYGFDLSDSRIKNLLSDRFQFLEGNIAINKEWVQYNISKCDIVIPLIAIATPMVYIKNPLKVFNLDFEENLKIIKLCVKYKKRVIFPSTSEVYGLCQDEKFDEEKSNLIMGPINKVRWIYACSKQMIDRILYAYGLEENLTFTIFRPFNWIGPTLDGFYSNVAGSSRVIIQFIENLFNGEDIVLVNGGKQRRCFTYIDDGIDCLMKILENKDAVCNNQIINIGNPENDMSIAELAEILVNLYKKTYGNDIKTKIITQDEEKYYGKGYQDMERRKPSIEKANNLLGWFPGIDKKKAIQLTFENYVKLL